MDNLLFFFPQKANQRVTDNTWSHRHILKSILTTLYTILLLFFFLTSKSSVCWISKSWPRDSPAWRPAHYLCYTCSPAKQDGCCHREHGRGVSLYVTCLSQTPTHEECGVHQSQHLAHASELTSWQSSGFNLKHLRMICYLDGLCNIWKYFTLI